MAENKHIIRADFFKTSVDGKTRNIGLDVVRGTCVLLIMMGHTNNILGPYLHIYRLLYPMAEMAQDLFFALSGYLIGNQILKMVDNSFFGRKILIGFYLKRWIRTIPFYFIFLVINLLLFRFVYRYWGPDFAKFDFTAWPYFIFVQNLYNRPASFFPEIWPVPVEEWSYILLPLPFLFFPHFFKNGKVFVKKLGYLISIIIIVQVLRIVHVYIDHPETDWELRKIVIYRMDALAYGFILAVLLQKNNIKEYLTRCRSGFFVIGIIMVFALVFFNKFLDRDVYNMLLFIYQPFACALVLPFFIFQIFKSNSITALFTHFSLTGYAFLLSHLYFLQFLFITFFRTNTFFSALLTTIIYIVVLVFFSAFFYNKIERPILLMRKK